jgi:small subunit ribosomal protein S9
MAEELQAPSASAGITLGQEPVTILESAPSLPEGAKYIWGLGRRKKATARVRIRPGTGKITINNREMDKYFLNERDQQNVLLPLNIANMVKAWDIWATVNGGGPTGQAGAVTLGIARALTKAVPDKELALRNQGLLTRDARMKERKKYGQKGARRRFQFSKR